MLSVSLRIYLKTLQFLNSNMQSNPINSTFRSATNITFFSKINTFFRKNSWVIFIIYKFDFPIGENYWGKMNIGTLPEMADHVALLQKGEIVKARQIELKVQPKNWSKKYLGKRDQFEIIERLPGNQMMGNIDKLKIYLIFNLCYKRVTSENKKRITFL